MGKVALVCPACQTKYRITIQGEVKEKISFTCKKCSQILEVDAKLAKEEAPTQELIRAVCEKCGNEFLRNPEDDSKLCYQCRIDILVRKKKQESAEIPAPATSVEPEKLTARYTFRNPEGLVLGPIKYRTAVVLIREKRITGKEEVSKDGSEFLPLSNYPELAEFFPELSPKPEPATLAGQIPLEEPSAPAETSPPSTSSLSLKPKSETIPSPESKLYHLRLSSGKLLGPVRKTTVMDLIECGFLCAQDQCSRDQKIWTNLDSDPEFNQLLSKEKEEAEIVDLTETIEE